MKLEVGKIYYDIEKEKIFAYTEKEITCPKCKSSNNYSTSKKEFMLKILAINIFGTKPKHLKGLIMGKDRKYPLKFVEKI
jgi:hypothetical protein